MLDYARVPAPPAEITRTGDALLSERERAKVTEGTTAALQQRVHNMAATSEEGNRQLTGQINKLRQQLDKTRRVQLDSHQQVGGVASSVHMGVCALLGARVHCAGTHSGAVSDCRQERA